MSTIAGYERPTTPTAHPTDAVRVIRLLCFAAASSALIASVLIAVLVLSSPTGVSLRIGAMFGAIGFGWSSVSLLVGAVFAAANTA